MGKKYTGIIHAYFFEVTGKKLKSMLEDKYRYRSDDIPSYVIRKDNKKLTELYYYQFAEDDYKIIICQFECADRILSEEISNCGLGDYEISFQGETIDEYHPSIILNQWDTRQIPRPTLVKMMLETWECWEGAWNMEVDFEIVKRK